MNDAQLLDRCRRGDQRAWALIVERYERLAYSIALNMGLSADDADDVTQATFAALLASIERIDEPERLPAWLTTVAKRQSIRAIERLARERERTRAASEVVEVSASAIDESIANDVEWLHQGLSKVSERCQELLTALYFSGKSYDEAAADLQMPLGSLGPTRQRCLEGLRRELAKLYDAGR